MLLVSKEAGQHLLAALQTGLLTTRAFGLAVVKHDPQLYRRLEVARLIFHMIAYDCYYCIIVTIIRLCLYVRLSHCR